MKITLSIQLEDNKYMMYHCNIAKVIIRFQYELVPSNHAASAWLVQSQQFSTYNNETSAQDGMLVSRPAIIKFHDFMLPMVFHLLGAEFLLDDSQYRLKCGLIPTSCCERQQRASHRILTSQHCRHLIRKKAIDA